MSKSLGQTVYTDEQLVFLQQMRDLSLSWSEIAKDFNKKFNTNKTANALRKVTESYAAIDLTDEDVMSTLKEAQRAKNTNTKLRKENKTLLDYSITAEDFIDGFKDIVKSMKFSLHKPVKTVKKGKIKRAIVMHVSDNHLGAEINVEELGGVNSFTFLEEARRLAYFTKEVADYKKHYRKDTELVIFLNGDNLQGIIHSIEACAPMTTQFARGLSYYLQSITYLAGQFKKVRVVCTVGNHGRFMHKSEKGRQTNQKWDSFDSILHIALKESLKKYKNVEFEIPKTPYAITDILGHKYLVTHGDTFMNVGNIGKSVSIESIKNKVNDLITGLGKIDVVVVGHVHVFLYTVLANNTKLVINSSLSGIDSFAQSLGIVNNDPGQQLFEVTEKHAVGDIRFIHLKEADKMDELDSIIKPLPSSF